MTEVLLRQLLNMTLLIRRTRSMLSIGLFDKDKGKKKQTNMLTRK